MYFVFLGFHKNEINITDHKKSLLASAETGRYKKKERIQEPLLKRLQPDNSGLEAV